MDQSLRDYIDEISDCKEGGGRKKYIGKWRKVGREVEGEERFGSSFGRNWVKRM